jgi:hypothetical protein
MIVSDNARQAMDMSQMRPLPKAGRFCLFRTVLQIELKRLHLNLPGIISYLYILGLIQGRGHQTNMKEYTYLLEVFGLSP